VISDIHAGLGGDTEDLLVPDERFDRIRQRFSDGNSVLVLAGDIFDLAEANILRPGNSPVAHIEAIAEHHAGFFKFLSRWILEMNDVVFVPGNHDTSIQISAVQEAIVRRISECGRNRNDWHADVASRRRILAHTRFVTFAFETEGVFVVHGHQWDEFNRTGIDPEREEFLPKSALGARAGVHSRGEQCLQDQTEGIRVIEQFVPLEREAPWLDNVMNLRSILLRIAIEDRATAWLEKAAAMAGGRSANLSQCEKLAETLSKSLVTGFGDVMSKAFSKKGRKELSRRADALVGHGQTRAALRGFARDFGSDVFVAGHTHEPAVVESTGDSSYYANTGTWTPQNTEVEMCEDAFEAWPNRFSTRSPVIVVNLQPDGSVKGKPEVKYMDEDEHD
jgi:UDP-2,3-diacylglucosamine pyrophosphatase LpxH